MLGAWSRAAYPLLIEPRLTLEGQARLWAAGYVAVVLLSAGCVLTLHRYRHPAVTAESDLGSGPAPGWRTRLRWVAFAFVPSSLMLGVTQFLATDIASVPLLWVVPLSIYLLTFHPCLRPHVRPMGAGVHSRAAVPGRRRRHDVA